MLIKITCDSSADLNKELYSSNNISVIPFNVTMGETDYLDGLNITNEDIFKFVEENNILPKTSAINEYQFEEFFTKEIKGYDAIVHLSISSKISGTYNFAKKAAERMDNVFVIDSLSLSSGLGIQVLYACELAKKGMAPEKIVEKVEARRDKVQISFATYKLDYLHKGGRCSSLSLLGANVLKIHPSINLQNGKMQMHKKYMGKMDRIIDKYLNDTIEEFNTPEENLVFITHASAEEEYVELARKFIKEKTNFKHVYETLASSTVTSHCGKNTIGIIYYNDGKTK